MEAKRLSNTSDYGDMRAAVAQLVEHHAVNVVVPGSSPGGGVFYREQDDERSEESVSGENANPPGLGQTSHSPGTVEQREAACPDCLGEFESWRWRVSLDVGL